MCSDHSTSLKVKWLRLFLLAQNLRCETEVEALAMVDQRLGLSEAASAAEQRMQISETISEKARKG